MGVSKHKCVSPYRNFIRFKQYLCVDCSETEGVMQLEGMRGQVAAPFLHVAPRVLLSETYQHVAGCTVLGSASSLCMIHKQICHAHSV